SPGLDHYASIENHGLCRQRGHENPPDQKSTEPVSAGQLIFARESQTNSILASSHAITDHFFCFTYDEHVWDCDHLIEEGLVGPRFDALEGSRLQSFAYHGTSRVLDIDCRLRCKTLTTVQRIESWVPFSENNSTAK